MKKLLIVFILMGFISVFSADLLGQTTTRRTEKRQKYRAKIGAKNKSIKAKPKRTIFWKERSKVKNKK